MYENYIIDPLKGSYNRLKCIIWKPLQIQNPHADIWHCRNLTN